MILLTLLYYQKQAHCTNLAFYLKGSLGPSTLPLLDFAAAAISDITEVLPARVCSGALQMVLHINSVANAALIQTRTC